MDFLDIMMKELKQVMSYIVVKFEGRAKELETPDSIRKADIYIAAMEGLDSFMTYTSFSNEALFKAGFTGEQLEACLKDKNNIPSYKRNEVVQYEREITIRDYVETNNYYRMLSGLPDFEDMDYIFIDEDIAHDLGINPNTPIHEFDRESIVRLEADGYINTLMEKFPQKKYIAYLGSNSINTYNARISRQFSILRMLKIGNTSFYEQFINIYDQCREYFMTVIYIKEYGKRYDLYDNFIALNIMVMTIQRVISMTFKNGIERDFYDLATIKAMFDSYNVPFIESLPLEYQKTLLRNLNNLLRHKSTDKVLYDIASLLGFERVNIFKYYLIKEHKLDELENPMFFYKEVVNDNGETVLVEDTDKMYSLYFKSVELRERNVALALTENSEILGYNQVTDDDPYWWEDDELRNKLYDENFNYVETKYISMNIMYKMTEMLFEVIYAFRMMLDKKNETTAITLEFPKLLSDSSVPLFNAVIFLCALIAKKNGMKGNVLHTPTKILSVMGFNFRQNIGELRDYIRNNSHLVDQGILKLIENLNVTDAVDINNLLQNIKNVDSFLVERMSRTNNVEVYRAYNKIYKSLMITEETELIFKKSDGTTAETFLEYLADKDIELFNIVNDATTGDHISEIIDHVISRFTDTFSNLQYATMLNDTNNGLLNAVIELIKFFKSYTADLTSFNIMYLMDSRYYNMIKMMGDIHYINTNMFPTDNYALNYNEELKTSSNIYLKRKEYFKDLRNSLLSTIYNRTKVNLKDRSNIQVLGAGIYRKMINYDKLKLISNSLRKDKLNRYDRLRIASNMYRRDKLNRRDLLKVQNNSIYSKDHTKLLEKIKAYSSIIYNKDKVNYKEKMKELNLNILVKELNRKPYDKIYTTKDVQLFDNSCKLDYSDNLNLQLENKIISKVNISDKLKLSYLE